MDTLVEFERIIKNLEDQAAASSNFDQRMAFMYASGMIRQRIRDLGLVPEPAAPESVSKLETKVIGRM